MPLAPRGLAEVVLFGVFFYVSKWSVGLGLGVCFGFSFVFWFEFGFWVWVWVWALVWFSFGYLMVLEFYNTC